MHNIYKNIKSLIIIFVLIIGLVIVGFIIYNDNLKDNLKQSTEMMLSEIVDQHKFNFDSEIKSEITNVKMLASSLAYMDNNADLVLQVVNQVFDISNFENIVVVDINGKGIANDGSAVDISDHNCFVGAMKGETIFSEPAQFLMNKEEIVHLATPIIKNDNIQGVLMCTYDVNNLDQLLLPSFDGKGYAFVINGTGEIIARTHNDYVLSNGNNLLKALETAEFIQHDTLDDIKLKINNLQAGSTEYSINGNYRYAKYTPLDVTDWYIFAVVPHEAIDADAAVITNNAIILTVIIVIGFVLFILYILALQKRANLNQNMYTKELEKLAYYDEITGLPNLNKFRIDAVKAIKEHPEKSFVIAKLDIVNFKMINEMFGFGVGDHVIVEAARFVNKVRQDKGLDYTGSFARIGKDEFILVDIAETLEETEQRIAMFERSFNEAMIDILGSHHIQFRYGRYLLKPGEYDIDNLIEKVNLAHHMAKSEKNISVYDYDDSVRAKLVKEAEIEGALASALTNKEFKVYLQPKYRLTDEDVTGAEALVRWHRIDDSIISPVEFVPICERNGFIVKLDMYMFDEVCQIIRGWLDSGRQVVPISVNFSRLHLLNPDFVKQISGIADKYQIPKKYLEVELTESTIFDNENVLVELIRSLHTAGFTLSMDDFGSGYSSLGLLQNLPVDTIKIDRGFFVDVRNKERSKAVIESMILMAKKLLIHTVAEGVETKEHIDLLRDIGCDTVQGYYYSKPIPAEDFFQDKD